MTTIRHNQFAALTNHVVIAKIVRMARLCMNLTNKGGRPIP